MEHFDELELIGFDEGNVVEARVGFDSKVVVHKEDEGVEFNMQVVGGGIGFKEEGWWEVGVGGGARGRRRVVGGGSWWRSSWKTKGGPSSWAGWRPIGRGRGRRSQAASGRGG